MRRTIKKYLSESREQKEVIDGKIISKDIFGRATVQTATGTFKAVDLRGRGTTGVKINNTAQNQNEFTIIAGNQERNIVQPTYYDLPVTEEPFVRTDILGYTSSSIKAMNLTTKEFRTFFTDSSYYMKIFREYNDTNGEVLAILNKKTGGYYLAVIKENEIAKTNLLTTYSQNNDDIGRVGDNFYLLQGNNVYLINNDLTLTLERQLSHSLDYKIAWKNFVIGDYDSNIYVYDYVTGEEVHHVGGTVYNSNRFNAQNGPMEIGENHILFRNPQNSFGTINKPGILLSNGTYLDVDTINYYIQAASNGSLVCICVPTGSPAKCHINVYDISSGTSNLIKSTGTGITANTGNQSYRYLVSFIDGNYYYFMANDGLYQYSISTETTEKVFEDYNRELWKYKNFYFSDSVDTGYEIDNNFSSFSLPSGFSITVFNVFPAQFEDLYRV